MKREVPVRPEQARYLMELQEKATAQQAIFQAALSAMIRGLVGKAKLQTISDDGTLVFEVEEETDAPV
jgi:hypothetical protein